MHEVDDVGQWWLPERPERKIPGWLTFTVNDGGRLRLVDSLLDAKVPGPVRMPDYPRILGTIGNMPFTLENCFASSRRLLRSPPDETIVVNVAYRGVRYEPDEEPCGDRITLNLAHLLYWVRPHAFDDEASSVSGSTSDGPVRHFGISARSVAPIVLAHPRGKISLEQTLATSGDALGSRSVNQDVVLHFDAGTVVSSHELMAATGALHDLVSLAMDRVACVRSVSLAHPRVVSHPGSRNRRPIEMLARLSDRFGWEEPKHHAPDEVLFHYSALGDSGLSRLLEAATKYQPELRRVMRTREYDIHHLDRLLSRCAALESFDRKRRQVSGRPPFKEQIGACMDLAGDEFEGLVGQPRAWFDLLKRRRNHLAHHLELDERGDGFIDMVMSESTYFLFALCLLREAKLPSSVLGRVRSNRRFDWIREQIPRALQLASPESR